MLSALSSRRRLRVLPPDRKLRLTIELANAEWSPSLASIRIVCPACGDGLRSISDFEEGRCSCPECGSELVGRINISRPALRTEVIEEVE
jgi:predicted RNA-binding Zn-ribbon protein involved in translation (DUF1610 family)